MKTIGIWFAVLPLLLASMPAHGGQIEPTEDFLKEAVSMNSKHHPAPTKSYRKGHIARQAAKHYVEKTDNGYVITLPGATPIATPTVYKGKLYVSGGFGSRQFYCFDAQSGRTLWVIELDDDGPTSCVIENDIVVFNTESCTLFACRADTGEMLWSWWLGDPLTSTPAIANGRVFTTYPANGQGPAGGNPEERHPDASHIMGCFDLHSGRILWQKWVDGDAISAPVVVGPEVYITTFPGTLYTFAVGDGTLKAAVKARATSAPTVSGAQIYYTKRTDRAQEAPKESIAAGPKGRPDRVRVYHEKQARYLDARVQKSSELDKKSKSLDAGNGFAAAPPASGYGKASENVGQGSVSSMQSFQGSRVLHYRGRNYNTMGDELVCTDPKSGETIWKQKIAGDLIKAGGFLATPPVVVNDILVVATLDGAVERYAADSGKLEKRYRLNANIRSQPAIQDGRIFVGTQNGQLVCIDTQDPKLTGWPTWGRNAAHTGMALN